ncbi:MAG: hypothetical protein JRH13_10455 [Deltaproteobacteria bacterium]|nr:hypothetical protein [Deltaproteobacteria bacterium]MBW2015627.1 hypothetical protein [Deltaproteobacteria bacterium]MBW2129772.1 hypothetical protein [Deltaproteobacteria bacterium]MBW2302488.1 hypothetical protein [Deltaproteobacteria bacterium]
MDLSPFDSKDMKWVNEAHEIAEDRVTNFYKFSLGQWKRHPYDVKTLRSLRDEEITPDAFALLRKGSRSLSHYELKTKERDFYFICLQDHIIQRALRRDKRLTLLPLLVYVFTHELVHIVRFCNFSQRFTFPVKGREKEESVVHETTFRVLKGLSLPRLDYVLEAYRHHRICDVALC